MRLLALLVVAVLAGTVAGIVGSARAGKPGAQPGRPAAWRAAPLCPVPAAYRPAFRAAARDTGLPVAMLAAVARVESNLEPQASSHAGARGLLQLLPSTAASLELDVDEPAANVLAGARYLRLLLDRFHSSDLALAAYNAGPTAVAKAGGAPTTVTVSYVTNVTTLWRSLTGCR